MDDQAADELILEGIVTTLNADGTPNISPMGPRVDRAMTRLVLRPYQNLDHVSQPETHGEGVFHVTDDVELLAHAAVGSLDSAAALLAATRCAGQ